ncbi:MAG: DUF370 domain-containing protein [Ruminococcus sp.]|jgi:regulator of extracellular matrix RemA (YlzA/DUF370 family)|nr:DUF370 domain-containing protein [Ruminococcus sp.]
MKFINIGFGNIVNVGKIVSVVSPESAPIKRIVQMSKAASTLIDATFGRKCKAVIITDSDYTVLSALTTETIAARIEEAVHEE